MKAEKEQPEWLNDHLEKYRNAWLRKGKQSDLKCKNQHSLAIEVAYDYHGKRQTRWDEFQDGHQRNELVDGRFELLVLVEDQNEQAFEKNTADHDHETIDSDEAENGAVLQRSWYGSVK